MKPHWNIWDVKNRWLRAAVTWAIVVPTVIYVVVVLIIGLVTYAVAGAAREVAARMREAISAWDGSLWRTTWRAMTLREPN